MADTEYQEGLSGIEVIEDFIDQIKRRLMKDCNLRGSDCYTSGYSGKAVIELSLYGMDTASVNAHIEIGTTKEEPSVKVEETVEVGHEADLTVVRERSQQPEPTLEREEEEPANPTGPKKRRYGKLPAVAGGGASDEVVE